MSQTGSTTTRIAKNAVALYIRSFIVMLISLYTSRVVLRVLGVDDLGIYNLVGGMVMMFAFLEGSQNQTYQRYYNYSIGRPDRYSLIDVFSTAINVQLLIAGSIFFLSEVVGLYLLFNHLVIPDGRETAAFWVFQVSILTLIINTLGIPYSAMIVSNEDLKAFAYFDVFNVTLKLLIVFIIEHITADRLIMYAVFLFIVQLLTILSYVLYCKKKYNCIKYNGYWNRTLTKEMASFSGWIVLSSVASILLNQGISILYNIFYGVIANAAIGIGNQVRSAIVKLTGNLTMSFSPQLVTNFAGGDWNKVNRIWTVGTKCALGLFAAVAIPVIIDAEFILKIWLKEPPEYTTIFLRLILIENLIRFLSAYAPVVVRASGKIKAFELISNSFNVVAFVLILVGFYSFDSVTLPYFILIVVSIIQIVYSIYVACDRIHYNFLTYLFSNTGLSVISLGVSVFWGILFIPHEYSVWSLLLHCSFTAIIVLLSLYFVGFLPDERRYLLETVKNIVSKVWKK